MRACFPALLLVMASLANAAMKAGTAKLDITPVQPIWLSGYSSRNHPSEGVAAPLFVKALAIESGHNQRVVLVTMDLIGIPGDLAEEIAARAKKRYHLERQQLVLNTSHTHNGPMVWPNLKNLASLPPAEEEKLVAYRAKLTGAIITVIGSALHDLAPVTISYGEGTAGFGMNRRLSTPSGYKIAPNPQGPVDHTVPVLKITDQTGKLRAVLFAYACHNTTPGDTYQINGDYAGYAQAAIERAHAGATALFVMLCGADQNPEPRGKAAFAEEHGAELATAVEKTLSGAMTPVSGKVTSAFQTIPLKIATRLREEFEKEKAGKVAPTARRGDMMLKALDAGKDIYTVQYPVEAVRFGQSLTLLALGGEVVVDYSIRMHREYPGEPLITAGYSNDVMSYIPSLRVLKEGGYEAGDSMNYYSLPGPYAPDVEDRIFAAIHQVMTKVGRSTAK